MKTKETITLPNGLEVPAEHFGKRENIFYDIRYNMKNRFEGEKK